jgi:cyclopropane-fatty-acyl-phospholipid synthase
MKKDKEFIAKLLAKADITINGSRPYDIQVHNEDLYSRIIKEGSLGLGEAYMDGWWDAEKLDEFFNRVVGSHLHDRIKFNWNDIKTYLKSKLFNRQNYKTSKEVAEKHYDLSPKLYMSFLDPYNQYTCGYFRDTTDLNKAQEDKLRLICEKLKITKGDKVLDIGCGWGGFAKFAAENYGCEVTGITISKEQAEYAREYTKGLPVSIKVLDYRDLNEKFDKVLICGMIEHVGYKNYATIFKKVRQNIKDDGLFLVHTIGNIKPAIRVEAWFNKYIFPNGMAPSVGQISKVSEKLFTLEDLHNFGAFYDPTLMAWFENFHKNWNTIKQDYDERFYRMWKYYLLSCAGGFRSRQLQLYQFVFSPKGVPGGYKSVR